MGDDQVKKSTHITVKHNRVTLLCKPLIGHKDAYRAIGTFVDETELARLIEQIEADK